MTGITVTRRQAWRAVALLFLLYTLAFIDRQMLNLMVGPIRASLNISDFGMSLLQGFGFAIFYTAFGIPIGWATDRFSRRRIIFIGVVIWALAASACGLATHYSHLLLGRILVGAGEAALAPAAYSLLADMFPRERLALPMSVMGTGAAIGTAAAAILSSYLIGWVPVGGFDVPGLGTLQGWQIALLLTGLPGIVLAPIVFGIAEPMRHHPKTTAAPLNAISMRRFMGDHKLFYTGHFLGFGLYSLCNYGIITWLATYLIRVRGWTTTEAAFTLGSFAIAASIPGAIAMGWLVDRWYANGRRDAHLRFFAIAAPVQAILVAGAVSTSSDELMLGLLFLQQLLASFTGVAATGLQIFTPRHLRGRVSAFYLLVFNLLGLGLGPSIVAGFTTFVFANDRAVGWSIAATFAIFSPIATLLFLIAGAAARKTAAALTPDSLIPSAQPMPA